MTRKCATLIASALALLAGCGQASEQPAAEAAVAGAAANSAASGTTGALTPPSFDCAKAESEAETLVCGDAELAALDRETARLYRLAETGRFATAQSKSELTATQRGWIKGRDDCWKADDKRACVVDAYAMRIAELRAGSADARNEDDAGISKGPLSLACDGLDYGIGATFITSDPGVVYLRWLDRGVTLKHALRGSGARYTGMSFDGAYELWEKGEEATLNLPGKTNLACRFEEIG